MELRIRSLRATRFLDRGHHILTTELPEHVRVRLSAKLLHDASLDVARESFVEPEVIPRCIRDEVAGP
jgi:hypothetical protein